MKRTVRDSFENKLQQLDISDSEHEDTSVEIAESVASDEFEESDDDDATREVKHYKLTDDVCLVIPIESGTDVLDGITCNTVSASSNEIIEHEALLSQDEIIIADVNSFGQSGFHADVEWSVEIRVELPKTNIPYFELFQFFLIVKTDKGWQHISSNLNLKSMTTTTVLPRCLIRSVVPVARRIVEDVNVTTEGYKFISSKDNRIEVDFPRNSVDTETRFEFQLITVDLKRFHDYKNYNREAFECVSYMSDLLSVRYNHTRHFNKNVRVQLPLCEENPLDDQLYPVFIRWNGSQAEVKNDILSELDNGTFSTAVEHFSDVAVVLAKRGPSESDISRAVDFLSGKQDYCTFITFVTYQILKTQASCWIECCESIRADDVAKDRKAEHGLKELPLSRTPDLTVSYQERVRVALSGNIDYAKGIPLTNYVMTYNRQTKLNHILFPITKRCSMGGLPYGIITFHCKKSKAHHSLHFNIELLQKSLLPTRPDKTNIFTRQGINVVNHQAMPTTSRTPTRLRTVVADPSVQTGRSPVTPQLTSKWIPTSQKTKQPIPRESTSIDPSVPMFSNGSLMKFTKQFDRTIFKEIGLCLGIQYDRLTKIENHEPHLFNYNVLREWMISVNKTPYKERVDMLKKAFEDCERSDIAEKIQKVFESNREFCKYDFSE